MKALSDDLRQRIHEAGDGTAEVAERFAVADRTVRRLKRRFREDGTLAPKAGGRGPAPKLAARMDELAAAVAERPGDTAAEHRERLGLPAARRTVARAMRRLGLTCKKSRPTPPSATGPT